MFDADKAAKYVNTHKEGSTIHRCAHYVVNAITNSAGGGQPMGRAEDAKNNGPYLEAAGFKEVASGPNPLGTGDDKFPSGYTPQKGDVAVIQPYKGGNQSGHMAMYDGQNWISDFQQRGMYSGPTYRAKAPPYKIYRHKDAKSASASGVQGITKNGSQLAFGDDHKVYLGPEQRHLSHRQATLVGGGLVTQGSASVVVGRPQYAVARVTDMTTDGSPIAIGEHTVQVG